MQSAFNSPYANNENALLSPCQSTIDF